MANFGDLRSAFQATPSSETWQSVCAVLETIKPRAMTPEIDTYVTDMLAHQWPDDVLRFAPREWLVLKSGAMKAPSRWSAHVARCNALDLSGMQIDNKRAERLAASELLAGITHLDLSHNTISRSGFRSLFGSSHVTQLRVLVCSGNYFSKGTLGDIALLGTHAPALERFDFDGSAYEGLYSYEADLIAELKKLGVSGTIVA